MDTTESPGGGLECNHFNLASILLLLWTEWWNYGKYIYSWNPLVTHCLSQHWTLSTVMDR